VVGNRLVTLFTNIVYNCYLSDMETGYKVMPLTTARSLDLRARGFELEPEITAKLLRMGHRIFEVPITYAARSREEGKKLTAMDGIRALLTLLRYRSWTPRSHS
jgi:dolichol-phosphate hexosyltransferase